MAYETFEEYVSSELEEIKEKLDLIMDHHNIKDDSDIEEEDENLDDEEDSENVI